MKILIVILILFFIVVIMFHFFVKNEGFWSINSNRRKQVPPKLENYKMITVPNSSVYKEDVSLFGLACADRLLSSDVYNTMVITNGDSSNPYSCYVGNYAEPARSTSTPNPSSTRPLMPSKKRPPILRPREKNISPEPKQEPEPESAPTSSYLAPPAAPMPIDNNKYSSADCLSSKPEGKKLTDSPLILGDLLTEGDSNYRIDTILDKSNPNFITGVFNTYRLGNEKFASSLADAEEKGIRLDTKSNDKENLKNIVDKSPGNVKYKPDSNMISSVDGWNPSGYFIRVIKAEDAVPLQAVNVAGDSGAKSLLNFNGEVKYAPAFGYMIKDLKNWVSSGKKPCNLYSEPPGNYNAYELAKYTYNKADPVAQTQIRTSYPKLKFLWDSSAEDPSEEELQGIYDGLPEGAQ
jgi:hypothetical protein